jgi:hypothetical protein
MAILAATMADWWLRCRDRVLSGQRRGFDSLLLLHLEGKDRVFDGRLRLPPEVCAEIVATIGNVWIAGGFADLATLLSTFHDRLPIAVQVASFVPM